MTSIGMDTGIPQVRRAVTMILALIEGVSLTREDVLLIRDKLKLSRGRPRSTMCGRGHVKTLLNRGARGGCLTCQRESNRASRSRQRLLAAACECGHARRDHEEARGECYHKNKFIAGRAVFDCECEQFREEAM